MAAKKPTLTTPEQQEAEAKMQEPAVEATPAAEVASPMQPVEDPNGRIYEILNKSTGTSRLVFAATQAQALRHVARDSFDVTIPSTRQALKLAAAGTAVEVA